MTTNRRYVSINDVRRISDSLCAIGRAQRALAEIELRSGLSKRTENARYESFKALTNRPEHGFDSRQFQNVADEHCTESTWPDSKYWSIWAAMCASSDDPVHKVQQTEKVMLHKLHLVMANQLQIQHEQCDAMPFMGVAVQILAGLPATLHVASVICMLPNVMSCDSESGMASLMLQSVQEFKRTCSMTKAQQEAMIRRGKMLHGSTRISPFDLLDTPSLSPPSRGASQIDALTIYSLFSAQFIVRLFDTPAARVSYSNIMKAADGNKYEDVVICTVASDAAATPEQFKKFIEESVEIDVAFDQFDHAGVRASEADEQLRREWVDETQLLWYAPWVAAQNILAKDQEILNVYQSLSGAFYTSETAAAQVRSTEASSSGSWTNNVYLRNRFMTDMQILKNLPTDYADCRFDACRPISCFLYHPEFSGLSYYDSYGNVVFKLRDQLKERSTFTLGDSMKIMKDYEGQAYQIFNFHYIPVDNAADIRFNSYMEAQIWGGNLSWRDVEQVWMDAHLPLSMQTALYDACERRGIQLWYSAVFKSDDDRLVTGEDLYTQNLSNARVRKRVRPVANRGDLQHISHLDEVQVETPLFRAVSPLWGEQFTFATYNLNARRHQAARVDSWFDSANIDVAAFQETTHLLGAGLDIHKSTAFNIVSSCGVATAIAVSNSTRVGKLALSTEDNGGIAGACYSAYATPGSLVGVTPRHCAFADIAGLRVASVHLSGGVIDDNVLTRILGRAHVLEQEFEEFMELKLTPLKAAVKMKADIIAGDFNSAYTDDSALNDAQIENQLLHISVHPSNKDYLRHWNAKPIAYLESNGYVRVPVGNEKEQRSSEKGTPGNTIDHIFVLRGRIQIIRPAFIHSTGWDLSDHQPVVALLSTVG